MKNKISAISEKLFPSLMDFCKKIIQTPSLSGQEASVAKLISEEMQKLGYDEVFTDEWGVCGDVIKHTGNAERNAGGCPYGPGASDHG